jgi:hypothetical protein
MTTTTTTSTTVTAPPVDPGPDAARAAGWQEIAIAVALGAPVPQAVYVATSGSYMDVTVTDPAHVGVWAAHLGLTEQAPRIYRVGSGTWQRTVQAERTQNGVWLTVHHVEVCDPPEEEL